MAYNKKTWLARLGQGLNKFIFNGGSKVTLDSAPDVVTQQGTPLSADNMNDLEQRIKSGFDDVDSAINAIIKRAEITATTNNNGIAVLTGLTHANKIIRVSSEINIDTIMLAYITNGNEWEVRCCYPTDLHPITSATIKFVVYYM